MPALGAEQMVAFCGGIYAVLIALRVDVSTAFLPQGPQSQDSPSQGLVPVAFPWEQYGAVVTALRRKGHDRPDLLGKAGIIPDSALKAMRYGMLRSFPADEVHMALIDRLVSGLLSRFSYPTDCQVTFAHATGASMHAGA